ncbi:Cna protein B-type domain protein (plasmid) [Lactobacillus helsingborgensis]|uniref:VaFE repeat-containing surface-anchored protein n=2 Tax=Lactobacillus TaxID=1578 RepID=A0AA47GHU0_9LACO|nr:MULTISPECIES: VaFE repeat-containing surface-anchored protein [Lactobacillus]KJY54773.1 LPXTG cell wall anchor domain protein [Lactobacillus melliventris]KJY60610.1 Cna protein B-type domain protein [Lactobacillus helsingborgensis]UZX30548.1 VaFE repeat-containing surface-anchored protein [Lactobacillus helsingborgensis]
MKLSKVISENNVKPHKKIKLSSAIGLALSVFLGSSEQAFAAGHHYMRLDAKKPPSSVQIVKDSFGTRYFADVNGPGGFDDRHEAMHSSKGFRFYCINPGKYTPYGTSKKIATQASVGVKKVLRAGFGVNSAEEMGFKGYSSEAEYATQLAVWVACGATTHITWHNDAHGKKVHEIYNWIQKHKNDKKYNTSGKTTLKIKATNVNKEKGTATLTPIVSENGSPISVDVTLEAANLTTADLKPIPKSIKSNKPINVKLKENGENSDDIPKASITATTPRFVLITPVYKSSSANTQNTVGIVGCKSGNAQDTWSFSKIFEPNTPPTPPEVKKIKAQFDLVKKDDEGNPVNEAKFDVYTADEGWSMDRLIGTITTDKNGVARSGIIDPGHYIAIEKSTGKNLDVDATPVEIDLTEENLTNNAKITKEVIDGEEIIVYHLTVQGPINNHKKPLLTSLLTNLEDNTKYSQPIHGPQILNEHLYFSHLVGTVSYNVHAWLVDKATGQPLVINGQKIEAHKTIGSPNNDSNDGGIEAVTDLQLRIPNASCLAGKDLVAFSEIARSDKPEHWTAVHEDLNDKNETVHFSNPNIHTNAVNKETLGKQLQPTDGETITDVVSYRELIPGKQYTLKGIIMDKDSGNAVMNDGKMVKFIHKFTPAASNGRTSVKVRFDAHHYRNHRLVVYESLYYNDYLLTDHRDLNDIGQSLDTTNPQLHTTLSDNTQKVLAPKKENTVEDIVRYTDLIPGVTYSVRGKLIDQVTGMPVVKQGVPVMATATFKPNLANGTITLTFVFDGTQYKGHNITAFESIYTNGRIVAAHEDLSDAAQTVAVDHTSGTVIPLPQPRPDTSHNSAQVIVNNNNNNNNNNNITNENSNNIIDDTGNTACRQTDSIADIESKCFDTNKVSSCSEGTVGKNCQKSSIGEDLSKQSETDELNRDKRVPIEESKSQMDIHTILPVMRKQVATNKAQPLQTQKEILPQTGIGEDRPLQGVGIAMFVTAMSSLVYDARRKQTVA